MRSIYARASVGFDLAEVLESGSLGGDAERDGESIRELLSESEYITDPVP